jgi:hypothetical protein
MKLLFQFLFILSFQFVHAQDSSRFNFRSKLEKESIIFFDTQKIDTFLFFDKMVAWATDSTFKEIVVYRKNNITYKRVLQDYNTFSKPIQIDNGIIDSFFINKVGKITSRKEKKNYKISIRSRYWIDPKGTFYHINLYYGKKGFYSLLFDNKWPMRGYNSVKIKNWADMLDVEMLK